MGTMQRLIRVFSFFLVFTLLGINSAVVLAADGDPVFKNGPYLLAPKTGSMVVAWESSKNVQASISYGKTADSLDQKLTVSPDQDAPDFQGSKMNLYHVKLGDLAKSEAGTKYYYKVELTGGQSYKASFTTLGTKPGAVKIMSLSDSHVFSTREKLNADIKAIQPSFIIHTGDLVEGTGAQTEQFSFWFKGDEGDFIHSYPVVYSSGNHDQGGEFFNAYVYTIQDAEYGATVRGDSSFDYAGAHISLMNSNPWGLFQMNSEATGKAADSATMKLVEDSMAWLRKDLASDAAKAADFRILTMHHPVSDAYTKRNIPAIAEPGKVDLMLSGHSHSYARAVSDNPEVGAATVYLTHQDARIHSKKGDYFVIDLDAANGLMTVRNFGSESSKDKTVLAATTVIAKAKQKLSYSNISITPADILSNGDVTVAVEVKNEGKGIAAAVIPVIDNGQNKYIYKFDGQVKILEPGASATLKGTIALAELGKHKLTLADTSAEVNVGFRKATFEYQKLRTRLGEGKVSDINGNQLHVKADLKNIGNESGVDNAKLLVNGKVVDSKKYTLNAGAVKTAEFTYTFNKAGKYKVSIGNSAPEDVYIEGSIQGMPIAIDQSGNGNDAYIHGAPELGVDDGGKTTLIFDGKRDYLEIPDTGKYTVVDAATGMVWANLPSKGTTKGGLSELVEQYTDGKGAVADHNPLMLKGIGLGWGTPYLFRIAVRETGKVTYGVCFHDDNGEFSWNDGSDAKAGIKKDTWVQYTSAFDFKTGGDAYQNGFRSAGVEKPVFGDAPVKNWEGVPMWIGLGFKNTLLTKRNRGMYHTMLPGAISQVRFYTSKISAAENDAIRSNPSLPNQSSAGLKIWLDFAPANLLTNGTHTTEWVAVSSAPSALDYQAAFGGKAGIVARIQTSDDQMKIKKEKKFSLSSGENSVALKQLGKAKFVRIVTEFKSDLNATESSVPVLSEYVLKSGNETRWNTSSDWNKGVFAKAAGHQSADVYLDHAKDFADYSGKASEPDAK
jgi:predicted MPP superfamily phosphohydrolase/uncharacterized cupredoxin-like copper-binding protein